MRKYVKIWEIKRCTSCGASITSLLLTIKPTCEWVLQQFMQEESDSNETWGTESFTSQYSIPTLWLSKWLSFLHLKDISQEILWQVLSHFATEMLATDPLHSNHWVDNFRHYDYHILSLGPLASVGDDFVLLNWENKKRSSKLPSLLPSIDATVVACDVCTQKRWAWLKWFENLCTRVAQNAKAKVKRTKLKLPYLRCFYVFLVVWKQKMLRLTVTNILELESRILRVTRTKSSRHIFFFTPGLCLTESWCGVANTCTQRVSSCIRRVSWGYGGYGYLQRWSAMIDIQLQSCRVTEREDHSKQIYHPIISGSE